MEQKRLKVFYFEDEPGLINVVGMICKRDQHDYVYAATIVEAIEVFKREQPDVTLLDISTDESDRAGVDIFIKIREINPKALCYLFTCFSSDDKAVIEAQRLGVNGYWRKPIEIVKLRQLFLDIKVQKNI